VSCLSSTFSIACRYRERLRVPGRCKGCFGSVHQARATVPHTLQHPLKILSAREGTRTGSLCMLFEENYLFSMHRGLPQITVHLEYSFSLGVKPVPRDCFAWLSISPALPCLCELAPENPFTSPDSSLLFVVSLLVFFNCLLVSFCPSFLISQNPLCRRHHAQPGLRHRKSTLLGWSKGLLWYTSPRGMVACSMKFSSPLNRNEMSDKRCLARRSLGNRGSLFVRPRNNHFRRVDLRGM
jgi:hypothetical protein